MGRSQIAEELFNIYSKKNSAFSAGTNTLADSKQKLKDVAPLTVKVLNELGKDISNKSPIRISKEFVDEADEIISLTEKENLPDYLLDNNKLTFWEIADPDGKDFLFHKKMEKNIEHLVKSLVGRSVN